MATVHSADQELLRALQHAFEALQISDDSTRSLGENERELGVLVGERRPLGEGWEIISQGLRSKLEAGLRKIVDQPEEFGDPWLMAGKFLRLGQHG